MKQKTSTLKRLLIYIFYRRGKNMQQEVHSDIDLANYVQKEFTFAFTWCCGKLLYLIKVLTKLILYPFTYLIKGPKNKRDTTDKKARDNATTRK